MAKYLRKTQAGVRNFEHRFIMENYIRRKLTTLEEVHHINGDKTDNRISNLVILHKNLHAFIHSNNKGYTRFCKKCGSLFKGLKTQLICETCRTFICKFCGKEKTQKFHREDRMTYCSRECRNNASAKRFIENPPNIGRIPWNKK